MTGSARVPAGPVFDLVEAVLRENPAYGAFRAGKLARDAFNAFVDAEAKHLVDRGLPPADVPYVKRLPASAIGCVTASLAELHRRGLIPSAEFDRRRADGIRRALAAYEHGPFGTFIYPEEGLLLWALSEICRPRHAIFLGAYYGYWARWALPAIAASGGRATLVDPDLRVCEVARRNAEREGYDGVLEVVAACGEAFLRSSTDLYDWVVIDAENPRDHPIPEQRGNRVYHSLLEAALPRLSADALLICHNILFSDATGDPAFRAIIARNLDELGAFSALAAQHFDFVECSTTEGVGVGRRLPVAAAKL